MDYLECKKKSYELLNKAIERRREFVTHEQIKRILTSEIDSEYNYLISCAQANRRKSFGENLYVRASIEFSNICSYSCKFCGMSSKNSSLQRYTLSLEQIFGIIDQVKALEITQIHFVSGESASEKTEDICKMIKYAKKNDMNVTLVLGRRSLEDYIKFKEAGADRYILKFETSNEQLYKEVKSNTLLNERIADLLYLRGLGFKIGTGSIIGLPGATIDDIITDLYLLKEIAPDMASVSVFSPNEHSEYFNKAPGSLKMTLRYIALMRIILNENPPYISCSSSYGESGQIDAIKAGANVISYHATPDTLSDFYSAYKGKNRIKTKYERILRISNTCGLKIAKYY